MDQVFMEADRLAALRALDLLDTPPDPKFDAITALATDLFDVPVALISLVDEHRQWFKSNCGLGDVSETSREVAFCSYAIQQHDVMAVEDATRDKRFACNPLVTGAPGIRFYAGAPLYTKDGFAVGTLCLIDFTPRRFTERGRRRLSKLADMVRGVMEAHQLSHQAAELAAGLQASSELNRAILDSSQSGILSFRPIRDGRGEIVDFEIVAANETNRKISGRAPEQLVSTTFLTEFPGTRKEGLFDAYCRVSETGEALSLEMYYGHEGLNDWYLVSAVRTGRDGVTATFTPITDRKRFEVTLKQLHELAPLAATDAHAHLNGMLELGCKALGLSHGFVSRIENGSYTVQAMKGALDDLDPGAVLPLEQVLCSAVVQNEEIVALESIDEAYRNANSGICDTPFRTYIGAPVKVLGELRATICFAGTTERDRTYSPLDADLLKLFASSVAHALEFRGAFQKVRELSGQLRLVLDNVPARIWYKDDKNGIIAANRAAVESVGLNDPSDVEGRRTEDLFPDMAAKYLADDLAVIESGEPLRNIVESYAPINGQQGWISTDKIPMTDEAGNRFILAVATDITDLKRQEEQLRRLNESLSDFAFVAAHDLQAPLRQAAMFADLLTEDLKAAGVKLGLEAADHLKEVGDGLRRMRTMVNSLYDLFRLETREIELKRQDLTQLAEIACGQAQAELTASNARVEIAPLPELHVNAGLMTQLFQNLLVNACKYSGVDAPVIRIHSEQDVASRKIRVMFEDNGVGIPQEFRDKVFEPFKRLQAPDAIPGAGIGLSLCRRIASMHEADLYVDGDYREGARFVLAFNY